MYLCVMLGVCADCFSLAKGGKRKRKEKPFKIFPLQKLVNILTNNYGKHNCPLKSNCLKYGV